MITIHTIEALCLKDESARHELCWPVYNHAPSNTATPEHSAVPTVEDRIKQDEERPIGVDKTTARSVRFSL